MINLKSYNRISLIYIDAEDRDTSEKYIRSLIEGGDEKALYTR